VLANELELLGYVINKNVDHNNIIFNDYVDFSVFKKDDYFINKPVIPLRTSTSCYYKQCAFCTHHQSSHYYEFSIDHIRKTIEGSGAGHFFLIDDMIHKKRLLEIAKSIGSLGVSWTCQLKPTRDLDKGTLEILHNSGLKMIIWGVESGSDRVLGLMRKGTNVKDISKVLSDSKDVGIKNVVYIMFGFPTETKSEFLETIGFLKENKENIDLVSTSIFGLQKGTPVYNNKEDFGITKIKETKRTILDPRISYEVGSGLGSEEARRLRKQYKKTIESINKYPKIMNYFREHMLVLN